MKELKVRLMGTDALALKLTEHLGYELTPHPQTTEQTAQWHTSRKTLKGNDGGAAD